MVRKEDFRAAMSRFATGVTVITTINDQGEPHSMTANAFTSVCLDPPTVLVCVAHNTHTYGFLERTGHFGVNILSEEQDYLGMYFARRPEHRQGNPEYHYSTSELGIPVLDKSMVFLGCRIIDKHDYGDHAVYFGEVEEVRQDESGAPLLFYQSRWYSPNRGET